MDQPYAFELVTSTGRKFLFAAEKSVLNTSVISREDDRSRWMYSIKENSYTTLKETIKSMEEGLRNMAMVEVLLHFACEYRQARLMRRIERNRRNYESMLNRIVN